MNNKYPFFKYVSLESKIHNMNSKYKVLWLLLMMFNILIFRDFISGFCLLLFLVIISGISKINVYAYIKNVFMVSFIYIIAFILTLIISKSLFISLLIVFKLVLLVYTLLILTFTTSISEIAWGFECLFIKLKKINVPVSKIALKIAMDIKFISTVFEQYRNVKKSMAYRGLKVKKSVLPSLRVLIPTINLSFRISRRMVKIMKLRFYGLSKTRTNYHENKITSLDKTFIVISFIIMYVVIWLGWCNV